MIQNMRDLGGLETADGQVIRPHMLVRSAQLMQAEEADLEHISLIIDLRTPEEQKETPDRDHGRRYLPIPLFDAGTAGISHEAGTEDHGIPDMAYLYERLVNECTESIGSVLKIIMRHDYSEGAVLWHCTEGKDRCGIITALVLEMLGADRRTILEDYLKTNLVNLPKAVSIRNQLMATHGKAFADSVYQAYIADERYLKAAWGAMGENYIGEKLGISEEMKASFRRVVLSE